jgi:hypothetical protein
MALSDICLEWLQVDTERMARVDPSLLATPVPSCPGWDVAYVIAHTSWVHRYWTSALRLAEGEDARISSVPRWPDDVDVFVWLREGLVGLLRALDETPASKTVSR